MRGSAEVELENMVAASALGFRPWSTMPITFACLLQHRAVQRGLTPARQNPTAAEAAQLRFWMRPARSLEQGWVLADRGGNTMRAADLTAGLPEELVSAGGLESCVMGGSG